MKLTKLHILGVAVAFLGSTTAFADDPQLQRRIEMQRAEQSSENSTTVAVYTHGRGLTREERFVANGSQQQKEQQLERHDSGRAVHYIARPVE